MVGNAIWTMEKSTTTTNCAITSSPKIRPSRCGVLGFSVFSDGNSILTGGKWRGVGASRKLGLRQFERTCWAIHLRVFQDSSNLSICGLWSLSMHSAELMIPHCSLIGRLCSEEGDERVPDGFQRPEEPVAYYHGYQVFHSSITVGSQRFSASLGRSNYAAPLSQFVQVGLR